jgi:predicted glycogen debranching enzyme
MATLAVEKAAQSPSIVDKPLVTFGRDICGDLSSAMRREWLVTNGIGGYASATVAGAPSRSYHGYLVAALEPPVARTVLVGGLSEQATYGDQRFALSTLEWESGAMAPAGFENIQAFALEGAIPTWQFALADALLAKRVWMAYGSNTTYVQYLLARASAPIDLAATPLITNRGFHALTSGAGVATNIDAEAQGARVRIGPEGTAVRLLSRDAFFEQAGEWWWGCHYREESLRGFACGGDLFAPGTFRVRLAPGQTATLAFTIEEDVDLDGDRALALERGRQRDLLVRAARGAEHLDAVGQQLTLAADQFLVRRGAAEESGRTVIAGYHWFTDWGRDTMIALPGLTIPTGRTDEAVEILRTFGRYISDGLLPNNFPDQAGAVPGYNTVDATLWYVIAIRQYCEATGDTGLANELMPKLREIVDCHIRGTRHGIGVDPADGLLRAGEPGVQLTWMDARVGDWVVTPRIGKPVEINALWYNVLRTVSGLLRRNDAATASSLDTRAEQVRESFRRRFVNPETGGLFDVIDGPDGDDPTIRPNQIFAISLPEPLLAGDEARSVLALVGRELLTSFGLRSLSPRDPAYVGRYEGDSGTRDAHYHQGTVWPWLVGPYVDAVLSVENDMSKARDVLAPFAHHLADAGLGSVSEILDGDPPHYPRGCVAQAWSVAEALRAWRKVMG